MVRIRLCEESLVEPILKGEVKCPVHLYSGQEAIAAGVCPSLNEKDYVFGTHRSHGHYLAMGCAACSRWLLRSIARRLGVPEAEEVPCTL